MVEFIVIIGLIVIAHRLRRASNRPPQPVRINMHYHFHFPTGPGERQLEDAAIEDDDMALPPNVVRLRK